MSKPYVFHVHEWEVISDEYAFKLRECVICHETEITPKAIA